MSEHSEPNPADLPADPLTEVTRKERRNLLIASMSGVLIVSMNLVPTRISAFGIEFSASARGYFVGLVAALVCYFFIAFIVYGTSDFFVWRKKYQDYCIAFERACEDAEDCRDDPYYSLRAVWLYSWSKPIAFIRIGFEFVVPLLAGAVSFFLLLQMILRS
jgi:hypothetical protein